MVHIRDVCCYFWVQVVHKTSTYLPLICITSVMHVQKALNFELWLLRTIQVALELKFNVFLMQKSLAVVLANGWVWRELHLQQHMNPIWKKCLCGTFVDTTVQNTYLSNTLTLCSIDIVDWLMSCTWTLWGPIGQKFGNLLVQPSLILYQIFCPYSI